jgi:antitoxin VapB
LNPRKKVGSVALNIKNPETERAVRELAELTGETITEAVDAAVRERRERQRNLGQKAALEEAVRAMQDRLARLPVLDPRTADEIIGYDENGLPS